MTFDEKINKLIQLAPNAKYGYDKTKGKYVFIWPPHKVKTETGVPGEYYINTMGASIFFDVATIESEAGYLKIKEFVELKQKEFDASRVIEEAHLVTTAPMKSLDEAFGKDKQ